MLNFDNVVSLHCILIVGMGLRVYVLHVSTMRDNSTLFFGGKYGYDMSGAAAPSIRLPWNFMAGCGLIHNVGVIPL